VASASRRVQRENKVEADTEDVMMSLSIASCRMNKNIQESIKSGRTVVPVMGQVARDGYNSGFAMTLLQGAQREFHR
jgi:primosomal replication protein N